MNAIARYAHPSADYDQRLAHTQALLRQAAADHPCAPDGTPRITLACSLGAEDLVLLHLIETLNLPIDVFVLDTGALHDATLALLAQLQQRLGARLRVLRPQPDAVTDFVATHGPKAMYQSIALRKACCQMRKLEPLARALHGRSAWVTGLRREQSDARSDVPYVDTQDPTCTKYNPLAAWRWGDVWHYIGQNAIVYNPLHDQFYPSIGCAPCTRAISLGEPFRAGRWWWEDEAAKECGLHVAPVSALSDKVPA
ncbi:MAG: phosphoadenylyl-sulfate reductase [Rhodoferax sp.]